jgi:lysylphosphatidylglycerol synthetase-like protein (DUF2156 family)
VASKTHGLARFWAKLGLPGQIALGAGLAALVCFSLPWYAAPDRSKIINRMFHTAAHIGWSAAVRLSGIGPPPGSLDLFPQLWLIPLSALALLVTAWLAGQRRVAQRLAAGITLALSVLALLVELSFYLQIQALEGFFGVQEEEGSLILPPAYSVTWGFWVAVAVSAVAVAASIYTLQPRPLQPEDVEESAC